MTTENQSASTSSAETNTENDSSQSSNIECVTNSVIVAGERLSEEPESVVELIPIEKWTEGVSSSSSKNSDDEDDCTSELQQEIVPAPDEGVGSFRNIVVNNSSDVHFGNNTYYQYQGPVTIKQFVYKGKNCDTLPIQNTGIDNFEIQPEIVINTDEEYIQTDLKHNVQNIINEDEGHNIGSSQGTHWLNKLSKHRIILVFAIFLSVVFIISLVLVIFLNKSNTDILSEWYEDSNLSGKLKIIPKDEWSIKSPENTNTLNHTVQNVVISDTVADSCTNRGKCTQYMRYLQFFHMKNRGWSDIAYNFLVGGDGYVYEGRGWNYIGSHSYGSHTKLVRNANSIGIGFIGTFDNILPPEHQILAAKLLIVDGVKSNYIASNYKLYAHRQLVPGTRPGEVLYENIKLWPHWTNKSYT